LLIMSVARQESPCSIIYWCGFLEERVVIVQKKFAKLAVICQCPILTKLLSAQFAGTKNNIQTDLPLPL
jgi:hypothetical protein